MNRNVIGCLVALLATALLLSLGLNAVQSLALFGRAAAEGMIEPKERLVEQLEVAGNGQSTQKIVRLDLEGVISSMDAGGVLQDRLPNVDTLKHGLEQAITDESVSAIVLRINSPGGEVTASDTIYAAVKAAAQKKPVVVFMDSIAASGGYYVACGATRVVASETTLTASIGVIMQSMSYHDLFDKVGLGSRTFASGAFKDTMSGARPMREDEKVYVQDLVNRMYERFLEIVSESRKLPKQTLRTGVADGRVVTGRQALEAKLVDQIGYIEDAYQLAKELAKAPNAAVVRYRSAPSLMRALGFAAQSRSATKVELNLTGSAEFRLQPGLLYYLPGSFLR